MIKLQIILFLFTLATLPAFGGEKSLSIGSYNLHNLADPVGLQNDLQRLHFVDIWGFQEVMFNEWTVDPAFKLILPNDHRYVVARAVAPLPENPVRQEGHAIVSRYPIERSGLIPLEHSLPKNRAALYALIQIRTHRLLFVNTDHDVNFLEIGMAERMKNLASLCRGIKALNFDGPIVLVGDFNTTDSYRNWLNGISSRDEVKQTQAFFQHEGWMVPTSFTAEDHTFAKYGVTETLDHLFFKNVSQFSQWIRFEERKGSDHFPIFAEIRLQ